MVLRRILLIIVFVFSFPSLIYGGNADSSVVASKEDLTVLSEYLHRIKEHASEEVVLSMADTLFDMASKVNEKRFQTIALGYKVDYYYYRGEGDSLKAWVERGKEFAESKQLPIYYYFYWQRLITYYISINYMNVAMDQTEKMLLKAVNDDYFPGKIEGEKLKGRMYYARGMYDEAKTAFANAIWLEKNKPAGAKVANSHALYLFYIKTLFELNELDGMEDLLKTAYSKCYSDNHRANVCSFFCKYYLKTGEIKKAENYLAKAKKLTSDITPIDIYQILMLNEIEMDKLKGNYSRALEVADSLSRTDVDGQTLYPVYISIYENMGHYREADKYLRLLRNDIDSVRIAGNRDGLKEQLNIQNVEKIKAETLAGELKAQHNKFAIILAVCSLLCGVFIILLYVAVHSYRIKKKLRSAEKFRTEFLQHLSHEVRTPLNSVVGFTDVLVSEKEKDNPDNVRLSQTIHDSSSKLISLISDAVSKISIVAVFMLLSINMIGGEKDNSSQIIASLVNKINQFENGKQLDSLEAAVAKAKTFAKEHTLDSYYFYSWQRLISYYIKINDVSSALDETFKMQEEAIASGSRIGEVEVEKSKGDLYFSRYMYRESADAYANAIEYESKLPTKEGIIDRHILYTQYANVLFYLREYDKMKEVFATALEMCEEDNGQYSGEIYNRMVNYFISIENPAMSKFYLEKLRASGWADLGMVNKQLYGICRMRVEFLLGNLDTASKLADSLSANIKVAPLHTRDALASFYYKTGNWKKANSFYHTLIDYSDSIRVADVREMIDKQLVMMNVNKLKGSRMQVELDAREVIIDYFLSFIIVMSVMLTVLLIIAVKSRQMNKVLMKSAEMETKFLVTLSHDVCSEFNDMVSSSEQLMQSVGEEDELNKHCRIIRGALNQLKKVINDTVDITEYNKEAKCEPVDINECIRSSKHYLPIIIGDNVTYKEEFFQGPSIIMGDSNKIIKVLANLIHNASKFTSSGEIIVKGDKTDNLVIYSVTDTGKGIPNDKRDYVFHFFTKLDTMPQGLGLGLSLSSLIADSINGSLTIDGEYTGGCRFIFSFPYELPPRGRKKLPPK